GVTNVTGNIITNSHIGVLLIAVGTTSDTVGNIESNNIANNGTSPKRLDEGGGIVLELGSGATTTVQATANFNRIVGNTFGVDNKIATPMDATLNWWGSNAGPNSSSSSERTSGNVNTKPWLVLGISAVPTPSGPAGTAVVTAVLTKD